MTSHLPQRYTPDVNERIIENASRILAEAASGPPRRRLSRNTVFVVAGSALLVSVLVFSGRTGHSDRSGAVAFDRSSLISDDVTGTSTRALDFAPPQQVATAPAIPDALPSLPPPTKVSGVLEPARPRRAISRSASPSRTPGGGEDSVAIDALSMGDEAVLYDSATDETSVPLAETPPRTLAAGTRIPIVLSHAIVTGPAATPVSATVEVDLGPIRAGSLLNGEAFAVHESDRAQVVFRSVVSGGRSVEIEGVTLSQEELGIPGKVIRKGSKGKTMAGRAVGALGGAVSALSFGLLGGDSSVADLAVSEMARQAGSDATRWAQGFSVSTKAVRVEAGARAIVFLRKDLVLP